MMKTSESSTICVRMNPREKYYANPGSHSTIYLGETTVLKHGAAHPFSTFLASKEGLSPTLLSWGYGDKGTYWIETVKADMDLGEYFITQIKDNLPDISKKRSLTHATVGIRDNPGTESY